MWTPCPPPSTKRPGSRPPCVQVRSPRDPILRVQLRMLHAYANKQGSHYCFLSSLIYLLYMLVLPGLRPTAQQRVLCTSSSTVRLHIGVTLSLTEATVDHVVVSGCVTSCTCVRKTATRRPCAAAGRAGFMTLYIEPDALLLARNLVYVLIQESDLFDPTTAQGAHKGGV